MWDFAKPWLLPLAALALIFSQQLRSCCTPFFFALLLALAVRKPVARLEQHLPRWLASLLILVLAGLLGLCFMALAVVRLWQTVPDLLEHFQLDTSLWERLDQVTGLLPVSFRPYYQWLLRQLAQQSSALLEDWSLQLTQWAAGLVKALPGKLFTFGIALLATFYAVSDWPRVRSGLLSLLPEQQHSQAPELLDRLKDGVFGWLKAQGVLMAAAFLILLFGFFLLKIPGAFMIALLTAIADALPFLGTGLILLPWALLSALQGMGSRAIRLVIIWLLATVCRTALEPRLLGKQAGVSPLLTLFVMYAGFQLCGLSGLILGPVLLSAGMSLRGGLSDEKRSPE